ncbi:MAG TPA: cellulase family glycosylhydrolase [Candidatus Methylacidiphilales bacterium]
MHPAVRVILVPILLFSSACALRAEGEDPVGKGLIHADGTKIVSPEGVPLVLRGVNLGNWLSLEMWLFGNYDLPDQKSFFDLLDTRFGEGKRRQLVETFRANWLGDDDFRRIRGSGMNVVRLPFHYSLLQREDGTIDEAGFAWIDRALDLASRNGLLVIPDLHGAPGGQSVEQPTGEVGSNRLWADPECRRRTVEIWRAFARRYRSDARIAAYDLLNEPFGDGGKHGNEAVLRNLCEEILAAIRAEGDGHLVFVPATTRGPFFYPDAFWSKWKNVGATDHFYPAIYGGERTVDAHDRYLASHMLPRRTWQKRLDIPFFAGEYNVVLREAGGDGMMRRYVDLFDGWGWAHTMWCYKAITPSGGMPVDHWPLVTNAKPLRMPDPRTASFEKLQAFFSSLGSASWEMAPGLRDVYAKADFPALAPAPYPEPLASRPDGATDDWNNWAGTDIGESTPKGGVVEENGTLSVYGGGWDINEGDDAFYFLHKPVDGNFGLQAEWDGFAASEQYAKGGLMIRESTRPDAPFVFVHLFPDGGLILAVRTIAGQKIEQRTLVGHLALPSLVEVGRRGGMLYVRAGGKTVGKIADPCSGKGEVGVAVLSHDPGIVATLRIRELRVEGAQNHSSSDEKNEIENELSYR